MSPSPAPTSVRDPKRFLTAFKRGLQECSSEAKTYGVCIAQKVPAVEKGICSKEFAALRACMRKSLKYRS